MEENLNKENIIQTSEEIDFSKTSKDVSTTATTIHQQQQQSRSRRSISEMSTPQVSKKSTITTTTLSETPPASKKLSTSSNNTPSTKRSNAKMSTGSMMAGSFSHGERRKKVSKVDSFELPNYPDEESKKKALDSAIQTELEFLEFAESLRLPQDNFLPSPIYEESPSSILREWNCNEKPFQFEDELQDKENTSPSIIKGQTSETSVTIRQKRSSRSPSFSNNNNSRQKAGLDHLESLVRLMEELSSLREQNSKLQKKVQDMEVEKHTNVKEPHLVHETTGLQNDRSMSSIGSYSIQHSPEIAVKTLNKIALNEQEQDSDVILPRSKKISDVSSPGVRSKSGKVLTRSSRLDEEEVVGVVPDQVVTSSTPEMGSSSKSRGSAWTKVKDVFKRDSAEPSSSPGPIRSASMQNSVSNSIIQQREKTKSMENFSAYLAAVSSSSSSSDNEDIPFSLYNINYDLAYDLSVQRSSSFSQVSELQPNLCGNLSLPRRHSMISIGIGEVGGGSLNVSQPTAKEEKKVSKSAWGKVKNMIYTRRDSLKKKDLPVTSNYSKKSSTMPPTRPESRKRTTSLSNTNQFEDREEEEYSDPSGIWMGPPDKRYPKDSPRLLARQLPLRDRPISVPIETSGFKGNNKPHLTLTLASTDDPQQLIPSPFVKEEEDEIDGTEAPQELPDTSVTAPRPPTGTATPTSEALPSAAGAEEPFEPYSIHAEKPKHANSCSPQAIRSSVMRSDDPRWGHKMKQVLSTKREEELISNSLSLPNSPLRNSAVFLYEDQNVTPTNANYQTGKDSSGSQSSGDWHGLQGEIQKNYEILQRRLSEEFQRKMQVWERSRTGKDSVFLPSSPMIARSRSSQSGPGDPVNLELNLSPDFKRKYDEWQKMKQDSLMIQANPSLQSPPSQPNDNNGSASRSDVGRMTPATSKKIRARPLGQQVVQNESDLKPEFRLKVAEWEVRKALAGQGCKNVEEIRKLMPDDFNRKLQEWELIKEGGAAAAAKGQRKGSGGTDVVPKKASTSSSREEKRKSGKFSESINSHEQDSVWIDKELLKIKREKQRLELDREKCQEKESRLEKIREALKKGVCYDREITVKTAKGEEFKFCGISDTFTRKLFEWEESRGIAPESSTIALLNNPDVESTEDSKKTNPNVGTLKKDGTIKRSRSEGSLPESVSDEVQLAKSKRSSEGNLSQNSPQSVADLDGQARSLKSVSKIHTEEPKSHPHKTKKHQHSLAVLDHHNHTLDLLLHLEHVSDQLQNQAYHLQNSTEEKVKILDSVHDLRHTIHTVLKYQASRHRMVSSLAAAQSCQQQNLSVSYSDLSCGELSNKDVIASDNETQQSALSSSHSMSRYGSESPLHSMLISDFKALDIRSTYEHLNQQERNAIEEATTSSDENEVNQNLLGKDFGFGYMGETDEDEMEGAGNVSSNRTSTTSVENNGKFFGYRILTTKRRTSSDNISTPNSGRSRSPSLLSSEYIPEEDDDVEDEEIFNKDSRRERSSSAKRSGSETRKPKAEQQSAQATNTATTTTTTSFKSATTTNIDQLYQLVHELKEKDLNYHKNLIAKKEEAAQKANAMHSTVNSATSNPIQTESAPDNIILDPNTGAISKLKKDNSHHKKHVRKISSKKEETNEKSFNVEDKTKCDVTSLTVKESENQGNVNEETTGAGHTESQYPNVLHTSVQLNVFVPTSKTIFAPVSSEGSQKSLECSYSVFMLDDDIRTNDGNTEWEPESEHGDLVCPIASSEFTSLEPIVSDPEPVSPYHETFNAKPFYPVLVESKRVNPVGAALIVNPNVNPIGFEVDDKEESGISTPDNIKPSEVKKDPTVLPMSKEGKKTAESHSRQQQQHKGTCSSLRSQLERCQKEVKRTISGGNLIAKVAAAKEQLSITKSLPLGSPEEEKAKNSSLDPDPKVAKKEQCVDVQIRVEDCERKEILQTPDDSGILEPTEIKQSESKHYLQSLCQERSKQLMKAKEQFFLGKSSAEQPGVQRVIVTCKDILNVVEEVKLSENISDQQQQQDSVCQMSESRQNQSSSAYTDLIVKLRKTNTGTDANNLAVLPSSVAFRRSLFEPKSTAKADSGKRGDGSNSLLLVDTLGTRSCPSSPNLTPRTRKKTPFNWNEAAAQKE